MINCINRVLEFLRTKQTYEAFSEWHYENCLGDIISDSRETVPCTLGIFHLAAGDPNVAIPLAANMGRDADTIATMVGGITGASVGRTSLKEAWVTKALNGDYGLDQLTDKLESVVRTRLRERQQRIAITESLLGKLND